ncbi:unnamed protein product [Paramecium sonneborni]|uniref:Uncharacterized protein n=1 Tax=Paramecium sonneborni TaxID=65129 RepID=A0A8S1R306_9CILI|nr:unnamed protein product [Paramecium sonneborni]
MDQMSEKRRQKIERFKGSSIDGISRNLRKLIQSNQINKSQKLNIIKELFILLIQFLLSQHYFNYQILLNIIKVQKLALNKYGLLLNQYYLLFIINQLKKVRQQ